MAVPYSYISAPLIGGFIGYITNALDIRMLFRPHSPKYVFGIHVPFTPGIIPKEKGRTINYCFFMIIMWELSLIRKTCVLF